MRSMDEWKPQWTPRLPFLTPREYAVICFRYGMGMHPHSYRAIEKALGISYAPIRGAESRGRLKLMGVLKHATNDVARDNPSALDLSGRIFIEIHGTDNHAVLCGWYDRDAARRYLAHTVGMLDGARRDA